MALVHEHLRLRDRSLLGAQVWIFKGHRRWIRARDMMVRCGYHGQSRRYLAKRVSERYLIEWRLLRLGCESVRSDDLQRRCLGVGMKRGWSNSTIMVEERGVYQFLVLNSGDSGRTFRSDLLALLELSMDVSRIESEAEIRRREEQAQELEALRQRVNELGTELKREREHLATLSVELRTAKQERDNYRLLVQPSSYLSTIGHIDVPFKTENFLCCVRIGRLLVDHDFWRHGLIIIGGQRCYIDECLRKLYRDPFVYCSLRKLVQRNQILLDVDALVPENYVNLNSLTTQRLCDTRFNDNSTRLILPIVNPSLFTRMLRTRRKRGRDDYPLQHYDGTNCSSISYSDIEDMSEVIRRLRESHTENTQPICWYANLFEKP